MVTVNESYVRESILMPQAKVVAPYGPLMPTFQGLLSEENVMALVEDVKTLRVSPGVGNVSAAVPGNASPGAAGEQVRHGIHSNDTAPRVTYLNHEHGVISWLLTKDHKRIGMMYLVVVTLRSSLAGFSRR